MQQLPPSEQILFSKHLAALHPHDGLAVSATADHRKLKLPRYQTEQCDAVQCPASLRKLLFKLERNIHQVNKS